MMMMMMMMIIIIIMILLTRKCHHFINFWINQLGFVESRRSALLPGAAGMTQCHAVSHCDFSG